MLQAVEIKLSLCCISFSPLSPLHDRLMKELQTVESCVEVVTAEMAALCHALQQQKKNVSLELITWTWSLILFCLHCFYKLSSNGNCLIYHESIKLPDLNITVCLSGMQHLCCTALL